MQLFLDVDGCVANFDLYAEKVFGLHPRKYEEDNGSQRFWVDLKSHEDFFYKLPLMPDAYELYDAVKHLNPTFLTGCPRGGWAEEQKLRWRDKYFPGVDMITCESKNKRNHMNPGDVIVDDWPKYKPLWEEAGGIFILHKTAKESIDELKKIGIL